MDEKDSIKDLLRRTSVEFMGTFYLVFFVGMTNQIISSSALPFVGAFVPGITLMVLVFMGGHISLGSFNPAVSLALTLRPHLLSWKALICYVVAELLGGVAGTLVAWAMGGSVVPSWQSQSGLSQIFFAELFASFLLVITVLNAGTSANNEGNSFYGLAIGGSLIASALLFGNISGAVLNPAVGMLALFGFIHSDKGVPSATWVKTIYSKGVVFILFFEGLFCCSDACIRIGSLCISSPISSRPRSTNSFDERQDEMFLCFRSS